MTNEIIPFGKYKGRPVEDAAADRQYSDWLMEQQWFRERFAALYATMAALHQPAETPEHNAMQAKFLDRLWCQKLAKVARVSAGVAWRDYYPSGPILHPARPEYAEVEPAQFEQFGADVVIRLSNASNYPSGLKIELKPQIGDDFPAVLRQVTASECNIVVVGYFQAEGATFEQVREMFQRSRIRLILQSEIENC